ncbi:MAG: hypothetical protein QXO37_09435 [Candidatus Nitrosocaldaceae archaeon]
MSIAHDDEIDESKTLEQVMKEHDVIMQEYKKLFMPRERNTIMQASNIFHNAIMNIEGSSTIPLEHRPRTLLGKYAYEYRGKRIKHKVRIKW